MGTNTNTAISDRGAVPTHFKWLFYSRRPPKLNNCNDLEADGIPAHGSAACALSSSSVYADTVSQRFPFFYSTRFFPNQHHIQDVKLFLSRWNITIHQTIKHQRTSTDIFIHSSILCALCFAQESIWNINFTGSPGLGAFFDLFWYATLNIPHVLLVTLRPDAADK